MTIFALLGWSPRLPEPLLLLLRNMLRDLPRDLDRLSLLPLLRDLLSRAPFACSLLFERELDRRALSLVAVAGRAGVRDRPRETLRRSGEDMSIARRCGIEASVHS